MDIPVPEKSPDMSHLILEDQISHHFVTSEFPPGWTQKYMPRDCLNKLITKSTIIQELSRDDMDDWGEPSHREVDVDEDLIKFIITSAKKLFAITLISGIASKRLHMVMKIFKASHYDDSKLPTSMDQSKPPWSHLSRWSNVVKGRFADNQWIFLAPVFREDQVRMELDNRHILPFKLASDQRREGNFSDVWEVTINKAHQERPMVIVVFSSRFHAPPPASNSTPYPFLFLFVYPEYHSLTP